MKRATVLIGLMLAIPAAAEAVTVNIPVVASQAVYKERLVETKVPVTTQECVVGRERARSRGWIEKGTNTVAGSTQGLVGAIIGGAIGSRIGKGKGRTAATVVGAVIGNQVGNNVNERGQRTQRFCRDVTRYRIETQTVTVFSHYNVKARIGDGVIVVRRKHQPGRTISVTVQ